MIILPNKIQLFGLGLILETCFIQGILSQSGNIDPEIQKRIDDFITDIYLPGSKLSKLGLSIVKDDGVILYNTGFGMANQELAIPNGNNTQFLIGSLTKSITATLVVKTLHELFPEMGESVVDTPIRTLIPSANFTSIDRFRTEHTTFRDLLGHRTCIPRNDLLLSGEPFTATSELIYRQRYAEEGCGMRSKFQYNNEMFVIAGELIGMLANSTYTDLLNEFFNEIGMNSSTPTYQSDDTPNMPFRAQPYYVRDNISHPFNTELLKRVALNVAAGGVFSTPNDLSRYMRFHLNKGQIDGKQIIPEDVMGWLTKPSIMAPAMTYKNSEDDIASGGFAYGLGLRLGSYDGWEYVYHTGYFTPYRSLMSLFPSQKLGIFSTSNEGPVRTNYMVLHAFIFELLKGNVNALEKAKKLLDVEKLKVENGPKAEKVLTKFIGQRKNASELVGNYGSGSSGNAELMQKFNNQTNTTELYLSYGKWYKGWLQNVGGSVYRVSWDTDVIQDDFANGDNGDQSFIRVENETLEFLIPISANDYVSIGKFQLGVTLDKLPPIPYPPDSCGPETKADE